MQITYAADLYGEKYSNDENRIKEIIFILLFSFYFIRVTAFFPDTYITMALHQRAL